MIIYVKWVWSMGVAYNTRRGFWVGLPVPETSFEKLGPMQHGLAASVGIVLGKAECC